MSKNYKQYDTRWAKLGYPKKPWYIRDCGCGEVAICNSIDKSEKYKDETPKTILPYCRQFAAPNGDGTYWSAPPTMMKHYGMTEVMEHQTMTPLWKELAKGGRVAVYLMSNRTAGKQGIKWTGSKHFICSVAYRYRNGKHEVYIKDSNSNSKLKNGWHAYEDVLRNAVFKVWSGKLPTAAKKKTVDEIAKEVIDGKWGNGDDRVAKLKAAGYDPDAIQKKVNELMAAKAPATTTPKKTTQQKIVAFAKKIAADNSWHYVHWKKNDPKTKECPICHNHPKGKYHGTYCTIFPVMCWHHGGGIKMKCGNVLNNGLVDKIYYAKTDAEALKIARNALGLKDIKVIRSKKSLPHDKLKAGDMCYHYKDNYCQHAFLYIGNGNMIDANSYKSVARQIAIRKAMSCRVAIRYIGK